MVRACQISVFHFNKSASNNKITYIHNLSCVATSFNIYGLTAYPNIPDLYLISTHEGYIEFIRISGDESVGNFTLKRVGN
jgi:hypothetical protein